MVSIIFPSRRMNMIPLARPTTRAAERMSLHPAKQSLAMLSASCLSAMPLHSAAFLPDDSAVVTAAALHAAVLHAFLEGNGT